MVVSYFFSIKESPPEKVLHIRLARTFFPAALFLFAWHIILPLLSTICASTFCSLCENCSEMKGYVLDVCMGAGGFTGGLGMHLLEGSHQFKMKEHPSKKTVKNTPKRMFCPF